MTDYIKREDDPLSAARDAVVEKAEAYADFIRHRLAPESGPFFPLLEAVRSYRALQKPEGKRPDQLELGSLFRFADQRDGNVWRLVTVEGSGGSLLYMEPGGASMLHRFFADDLVIPIPEPKE